MTRRALPPPLPSQVTAIQRERVMLWLFLAVAVGLAGGFYTAKRGETPLSNALDVVGPALPVAFVFFNLRDGSAHALLLGAFLLMPSARLLLMHPTPTFAAALCATIATVAIGALMAKRNAVATGLVVLLALVVMAFHANRILGPWVQLG